MADIVIINPRFETSFWGVEHSVPLLGKRANLPVSCLPLIAALTPDKHHVTLLDENVEPIDFDRLEQADIVGLTGMCVQRRRLQEIMDELRLRGMFTVVGGSFATVEPECFQGLADVVFIGEADESWPRFLEEWEQGAHQPCYRQADVTDMTTLPPPRLELLKTRRYMFGSMQISRGCPYQCEFCDIIVTFGRRPRLKTSEQVLAELDSFLQARLHIVFVVDDNLIGNKQAIKPILREVIEWQRKRAYPLAFFTEASLDLAEDDELMQLMAEANFQSIFVGIESPSEESLIETKKYQNVRPQAGTILDRVHKIQSAGFDVWAGMILGFDHDDKQIFDRTTEFLQNSRIAHALVGLLYAIPTTPLHARLKKDGRLDESEQADEFGTNVIPLQMSREELRDGYVSVMQAAYDVNAYFDRVDELFIQQRFRCPVHTLPLWRRRWWARRKQQVADYVRFAYIYRKLMREIPEKHLRDEYRRRLQGIMRARPREPDVLFIYAVKATMHYHYHVMLQEMTRETKQLAGFF